CSSCFSSTPTSSSTTMASTSEGSTMSRATHSRAQRKIEGEKIVTANENQPKTVDIMKASPEQLRAALLESQATIAVMRNEATIAATQLTQARTVMRQQAAQLVILSKRLGGTQPKKK